MMEDCYLPMRANNFCNKHNRQRYPSSTRTAKNTIINEVSALTGLPYKKARTIINIVCNTIKEGLKRREEVKVRGFGTFGHPIKRRKDLPKVYFRPSKQLRWLVNHTENQETP
jgi:nucleoid DNA-binding protein